MAGSAHYNLLHAEGDANRSSFTTANKYLFADLLFIESGEGDEPASPSFAAENESLDASSSSLEASIANYYMRGGCKWGRFHNGKQILVCRSFILYSSKGQRSNVSLFIIENAGIEASSALLEALIAT